MINSSASALPDGHITDKEIKKTNEISGYFQLSYRDFESIKTMFIKSADEAFEILEVDEDASDADIEKLTEKC